MPAPATPPDLELSILGPLRARRGSEELALGGRQQRAVLTRLALSGGDPVAVPRLIDDLWSGEPPASATNTVQSYVSNLRRILGGDQPAIERVGEAYRLALGADALAADRFEALVAEAEELIDTDPVAVIDRADQALALWHGPAIAEFADEAWAQADAVRLEEERLAITGLRFDALLALGRHALAVGEIEAAVTQHPLHEPFAVQLVLALYRCGRQAEALRAVERTRSVLADEVGVGIGPELTELAAAVLDQDPSLAAPDEPPSQSIEAGANGSNPLALPPAVTERRARTAFVGRAAERAIIDEAWSGALDGERRVVVISGEAGVGKTRLAQETARSLHETGAYVLWGRCAPENLIAYQPIVEALRTALRSLPPERVHELVNPRPPLGLLLPELAQGADLPARTDRFELYEALADLLGEVSLAIPVLFVIDDLQWADQSTLTLLDHVLANPRGGRTLIIATVRRPAGRSTAELDRFLAEARRAQRFSAIDLSGMDREETGELLAARGVEAGPADVDAVLARTSGNPFFIEALADGEHEVTGESRELPTSIRDVFDARFAELDAEETTILTAAAVIGQRVDIDLLADVCQVDLGAALDVLDRAVESGLLAEDEEIGWVTFPHALVRQSLIARTTRNREARLHVRVADAMESRPPGPDHATTVAQHLVSAGRACPPERSARAAVIAGRRALEVVADEEALIWARRALSAVAAAPPADPGAIRVRGDALLLAGEAARLLGDLDVARATLAEAMDLARAHGLATLFARATQQQALLSGAIGFSFSGIDDGLIALTDEALAAVGPDDHAERAMLLAWSSLALNPGDDRDGQDALSIASMEEAAQVPDDSQVQALSLFARHMAVGGPGGLDERLWLLEPLRSAARGWSEMEVLVRALRLVDLLEGGRIPEAEGALDDLRTFVEPFHRPAFDTFVAFFDAMWATLRGDLSRAEERSNHGLTIGADAHGDNAATAWAGQQFLIALERGQLGTMADELRRLRVEEPLVPVWGIGLARALVSMGELDEARQVAHDYLGDHGLTVHPRSVLRYVVAALAAEVCWLLDDELLAEHLLVELAPIAHRVGTAGLAAASVGHLTRHLGLVMAVSGDLDAADGLLQVAEELASDADFAPARAHALLDRAVVLRRRAGEGDEALADELEAEGQALAIELGLAPELPSR